MKKNRLLLTFLLAGLIACIAVGVFAGCNDNDNEKDNNTCAHTNYKFIAAVDATCIQNGNTEYWHCEDCGKYFSDADAQTEINLASTVALADDTKHSCGALIEGEAATCQTPGKKDYYHCETCGKNFDKNYNKIDELIIVNPNAHTLEDKEGKAATCVEDGFTAYKACIVEGCDYVEGKNKIAKLNHSYVNWFYDYANNRYIKVCANDPMHMNYSDTKDAGEEAEFPYLINNAESLKSALAAGGFIKLTQSVALSSNLAIKKDVTIDLDGKTLTLDVASSTACTVSEEATVEIFDGKYVVNVTASASSVYGIRAEGAISLSRVSFNVNLNSTRTSSSQSLYAVYACTDKSVVTLQNTSVAGAVTAKENANCQITVNGIYAYKGKTTINGGSLNADTGVNFGSTSAKVTLGGVNIDYSECGINMQYNGGSAVILSGVTFSGALTKPAIIVNPYRNNPQIDDSQSQFDWTLTGSISDCGSYNPVIECYQSDKYIKHVYTNKYPEHTYNKVVYNEDWMCYETLCAVCGNYGESFSAGESERYYYPVKDEMGLKNAALNAEVSIKLERDITITSLYFYELKDGCVLDLNGFKITVNDNVWFNLEGNNVTIKNGRISRPANADYSYGLKIVGGSVTVDGITIDSGINVSGATANATIKNCAITLSGDQSYYQVCAQQRAKAVVENCTMVRTNAGKANNYFWVENGSSMTVTGCAFESNCGTTYYNADGVAPTFDFDIEQ